QVLVVDGPRVATRVVGGHPQVVVAGDERLAAVEAVEQGEAGAELVAGPDVAGQDQKVGRVGGQVGEHLPGGGVAGGVDAPVQVGGDGNTHRQRFMGRRRTDL